MTAIAPPERSEGPALITVRDATPADNAALVALAAACTMEGDIALRIDRAPDFFALNALEGDEWRVGVAENEDGDIVGCAAASRRTVWTNGVPSPLGYASDLKVHPSARKSGVADLLTRWIVETLSEICGAETPTLLTILAGNGKMENRARGPRGTPVLARFATLSVVAIPLLWQRRESVAGYTVRAASVADLEPMTVLWRATAPQRQFADVVDAASLGAWIARAPGLSIEDYLLVHDSRGRLRGFAGIWDQAGFKEMRVVGYSARLALVRRALNLAAPLAGVRPLPAAGDVLPALATVHVCADEPGVLRALLLEAYRRNRGRHSLLTLGLDVRDPLLPATRGLLAQPARVHAYITTPRGSAPPELFVGRPLHHETALV